jgi:hypothetical protein
MGLVPPVMCACNAKTGPSEHVTSEPFEVDNAAVV